MKLNNLGGLFAYVVAILGVPSLAISQNGLVPVPQVTDDMHFDLACSTFSFEAIGTYSDGGAIPTLQVGESGRVQLDLGAMRYRKGRFVSGIESLTNDEIQLSLGNDIGTSVDNTAFVKTRSIINRRTNMHTINSTFYTDATGRMQTGTLSWTMACHRVDFTGGW